MTLRTTTSESLPLQRVNNLDTRNCARMTQGLRRPIARTEKRSISGPARILGHDSRPASGEEFGFLFTDRREIAIKSCLIAHIVG
jgi:hypothetical protein